MKLFMIEVAAAWMAGIAITTTYMTSNDDQIQAYCLCGSVAGSFAYILKQKIYEQDGVVATFFTNFLIALIFSPFLCDYLPYINIPVNFRSCLALSGGIGLTAPWILATVFPILGKKIIAGVKAASPRSLVKRLFDLKDRSDGKL